MNLNEAKRRIDTGWRLRCGPPVSNVLGFPVWELIYDGKVLVLYGTEEKARAAYLTVTKKKET